MVKVLGNATTGTIYNDTGRLDLPRDTATIRPAHQPWCTDCKRKGRELDTDQRCPQCARAAITRAEGAARRAEAERLAAEQAKQAAKTTTGTPTSTKKLPTEGNQGKPTTRSSAPRTTSTSSTSGRAPDAGSSTHREKNPPAVQETRPATVGGPSIRVEKRTTPTPAPVMAPVVAPTTEQNLDAQIEHAATLLRTTASHPHPGVRAARTAVIATLEALHLTHELAGSATPNDRPDQADRPASAPQPTAVRPPRPPRPPRRLIDHAAIIREYQAGDTPPTIGARHNITATRVRQILDEHHIPRRDDRARAGGRNRFTPTTEQVEQLVRRYADEQTSIAALAEEHGIHRRVITRILIEAGVTIRPPAHARHTTPTPETAAEIVAAYRDGATIRQITSEHHLRAETARRIITAAGIEVRAKGSSAAIGSRLTDLGVTAKQVKEWAVQQGLLDHVTTGLVPARLVEQYAAAHRGDNT